METIWLHIHAPFAAFRGFQASVYRATSPVMPPSIAYGLLLNLAGIEMRGPITGPVTEIQHGLPRLLIAVGVVSTPERCSIYQQLHGYPVGESGAELSSRTHGAKFWITPVRREILVDYDGVIGAQSDSTELPERVRKGLHGELDSSRYGVPFAGDNNLLIDQIDVLEQPPKTTRCYAQMQPDEPPRTGSCRLTV